ncbi:MAG: Sua5/YciO/YrdC/YwlC family protein, partial [Coriobacteriia bacterium]|nr:Sua5/YciO/YrdC/YwlC family protein [Coriobacteriia bacterium]
SGRPAPGDFTEVEERIIAAADVALDGGATAHRQASTVVVCTGAEPRIVREGAIPSDAIMSAAVGGS